jgi:hypothetical protein
MSVDLPSMFMGAAIAFGFSVLLLFVTRALRHSGEIQFKADDLLKDREKLFDGPLDAEEHEQLPASSHRLGGWKEVGTIRLPSREPVIVKMKGTIADAHKLDELITGCDEVRLRATREDTSPFEKHMAWITTTFRTT